PVPSLDATRRMARVRTANGAGEALPGVTHDLVRRLAATMIAAEAAGGAAWCLDTATSYAKVREQFGRPIGQFQAVKHRCADMLVTLEQARAVAWDGARPARDNGERSLAASVGGASAPAAFFQCAKGCIHVLGGNGFTLE